MRYVSTSTNGIELLCEAKYLTICRRITRGGDLAEDLQQETILTILNKGFDLKPINERGELSFLFSRFAYLTFRSNSFRKKYLLESNHLPVIEDILDSEIDDRSLPSDEEIEALESKSAQVDAVLYEFYRQKETKKDQYLDLLLKRYIECNESSYKLEAVTGIPARTIQFGINKAREKYRYIYEATRKG